MKSNNGNA
jgi:hypothetical protein